MSILKSKPQTTPVMAPATTEMEKRIRDLESQIKYNGYSPAARAIVEENDRRDAEQDAQIEARYIKVAEAHAKRENLIWDTAKELLKTGNLKITINGEPVRALNTENVIDCPQCGTSLKEVGMMIYNLSERWIKASGDVNMLVIRDARGPLSPYVGMPCVFTPSTCRACGSSHKILIQLSM